VDKLEGNINKNVKQHYHEYIETHANLRNYLWLLHGVFVLLHGNLQNTLLNKRIIRHIVYISKK
jgi:hypothetical protein